MAKFNVIQKKMRAHKAERKRAIHGDPATGKLKVKPQNHSVSGKRKRKLLRKQLRNQKEAAAKGLLIIQDVEMAVADDNQGENGRPKTSTKFPMKKAVKLKRRGKNKSKTHKPGASQALADAMVE